MDGAGNMKVLWKVVMPMTKSSFITFGLMSFITMYNSYMWPSLITNDKNISLVSQGLRSFFIEGGAYGTEWPKVMAASAVIVVPLLVMFAFTQKWFINGIGGDTGVKGQKDTCRTAYRLCYIYAIQFSVMIVLQMSGKQIIYKVKNGGLS